MHTAYKKRVAKNFGGAAETYDAYATVQKQAARNLAGFLPDVELPRILEIGCSTGVFTKYLVSKYPASEMVITDIAPEMVAACERAYNAPKRVFRAMDGEAPDVDGSFDLIAAGLTVQWFEDFENSMARLQSLLKPGGKLLFSTLGPENFREWKSAVAETGLVDPTIPGQKVATQITEDFFPVEKRDFLKILKYTGAYTARDGHTPLTVSQIRNVLRRCEERITYHVVYAALSSPASNDS